ncbi:MAG: hypothetical protein EAZ09_15615 [Oscillatoriales cyanobacterium]|nr:MAG: hypothetical protein EAZ09_15615 [Oscillatoriales cyanobacterium]
MLKEEGRRKKEEGRRKKENAVIAISSAIELSIKKLGHGLALVPTILFSVGTKAKPCPDST